MVVANASQNRRAIRSTGGSELAKNGLAPHALMRETDGGKGWAEPPPWFLISLRRVERRLERTVYPATSGAEGDRRLLRGSQELELHVRELWTVIRLVSG